MRVSSSTSTSAAFAAAIDHQVQIEGCLQSIDPSECFGDTEDLSLSLRRWLISWAQHRLPSEVLKDIAIDMTNSSIVFVYFKDRGTARVCSRRPALQYNVIDVHNVLAVQRVNRRNAPERQTCGVDLFGSSDWR
jgi:hypothetical protein